MWRLGCRFRSAAPNALAMPECVKANRETVFVIDADPAVRDSIAALLTLIDLEVEGFPSAEDLLERADLTIPACLVTEAELPGMSGMDLITRLRRRGVNVPVIIVASEGDVQLAVEAMRAGAADFLEKPFLERQLLYRIQQELRRQRRAQVN